MANPDPTKPLRLRVLMALTDALRGINPTATREDGTLLYRSGEDMANKVFRGRNKLGVSDPYPSLAILEAPQQADFSTSPVTSNVSHDQWQILLKGDVEDDREHPTDPAHILMADVKTCLVIERNRLIGRKETGGQCNILGMKGVVTTMNISPGIVRPSEENISPNAFFWLMITLKLAEDRNDPYKGIDLE